MRLKIDLFCVSLYMVYSMDAYPVAQLLKLQKILKSGTQKHEMRDFYRINVQPYFYGSINSHSSHFFFRKRVTSDDHIFRCIPEWVMRFNQNTCKKNLLHDFFYLNVVHQTHFLSIRKFEFQREILVIILQKKLRCYYHKRHMHSCH